MKKLKQREPRAKELASLETDESPKHSSCTPPITSPLDLDVPDFDPKTSEIPHSPTSSHEAVEIMKPEDVEKDHENGYFDFSMYQNVEHKTLHRNS